MLVWRASAIVDELRQHRPDVLRVAEAWAKRAGRGRWTVPARVMRRMSSIPIDRSVLERSGSVWMARGRFGWSDVGNWSALAELLAGSRRANAALGAHRFVDSSGCLAVGEEGLSVMVGLRNVIAVRDGTTVLVCHRDAVQKVRGVVKSLTGGARTLR